jgi:exo-beta-1,3-glucanase (GH17 family)
MKIKRIILFLSLAILLCIPASSYIYTTEQGAQQTANLPADCSRPVNRKWIDKVEHIRWVAYSPPNPDPGQGYYQPTPDVLYRDLLTLKKANFTGLITYGSAGIMGKQFLTIAQSLGYQGVIMGIWNPRGQDELNNAIHAAGLPIVLGYSVGNEGLSGPRDRYTIADLCSAISALHAGAGKPATTSEDIETYYRHPELMTVGDWVFAISHPYWHFTKYAPDAIQWEQDQYAALVDRTKRFVFFKEVGLPTAGASGLSEANQALYYRGLAETNVQFAYFEGFDQPSKTTSSVEPHWGIFHSDLTPKLLGWDLMGYRLFTPASSAGDHGQLCTKANGDGCTVSAPGTILLVGNDLGSRHYSAVLSFNTSGLPDGAVVTGLKLKVRTAGIAGTDPIKDGRDLSVDICMPPNIKTGRSQGAKLRAAVNCNEDVGLFDRTPNSGWYTADFLPAAYPSVSLNGTTLFRLSITEPSGKNAARAYIKFYSGVDNELNSPILLVKYSLP